MYRQFLEKGNTNYLYEKFAFNSEHEMQIKTIVRGHFFFLAHQVVRIKGTFTSRAGENLGKWTHFTSGVMGYFC